MSKDKKVISVTLEPRVIEILDAFTEKYGFTRSSALNFILKYILILDGSSKIVVDMVSDLKSPFK